MLKHATKICKNGVLKYANGILNAEKSNNCVHGELKTMRLV